MGSQACSLERVHLCYSKNDRGHRWCSADKQEDFSEVSFSVTVMHVALARATLHPFRCQQVNAC